MHQKNVPFSQTMHSYPRNSKSGVLTKNGWVWKPADWEECECGLFHSNRIIPDIFWDKWRLMKHEPTLKDGRPKDVNYSAGIILVREKHVWVTQAYRNCYGFIKGSYENDENFLVAALREFKEETGTELETDLTKCDQIQWFDVKKRRQFHFFIVKVDPEFEIKTLPIDDVEITSFGWYKINKLKNLKFSKSMKEISTQFMEFSSSKSYTEFYNKRNKRLRERNIAELMSKI